MKMRVVIMVACTFELAQFEELREKSSARRFLTKPDGEQYHHLEPFIAAEWQAPDERVELWCIEFDINGEMALQYDFPSTFWQQPTRCC